MTSSTNGNQADMGAFGKLCNSLKIYLPIIDEVGAVQQKFPRGLPRVEPAAEPEIPIRKAMEELVDQVVI
jgi:hypothetical protein